MPKSDRMLTVLSLLQARRDWPARTLAQRLDISERTVRRDVDRLRELGYRIRAIKGPDGGYRLDAGSELPPLLFDDEQAIALAVALRAVTAAGSGFEEPGLRALATVRQVLPQRLRQRVDALRFTAVEDPRRRAEPVDAEVLLAVSAAVRAREVLRFDYASPDSPPTVAATAAGFAGAAGAAGVAAPDRATGPRDLLPPRRVEPHDLVARHGRWYLVAFDLDRDAWRTFRVDRLSPRTPAGPRFVPRELPGGDVSTFVAARFKGSETADEWPCRGDVILHLPASAVAPYLAADELVDTGDELAEGRYRLRIGAWSWGALAGRIGQFDADFEIVGPPELAAACAALGRRFAGLPDPVPPT